MRAILSPLSFLVLSSHRRAGESLGNFCAQVNDVKQMFRARRLTPMRALVKPQHCCAFLVLSAFARREHNAKFLPIHLQLSREHWP